MKRFLVFCLIALYSTTLPHHASARTQDITSITVLSDPSLTVPLNLIARHYARDKSVAVTTTFSSTKKQIVDIEEGAEANILISAKASWIKLLQQKGLIDVYSRSNIARNRLVLAGSQFSSIPPKLNEDTHISDITNSPEDFMFGVGDPEFTAEGTYGLEVLNHYNLLGLMEPYYHFFSNMHTLAGATKDKSFMSLMMRTDAMLHPDIKSLQTFPKSSHIPIIYEAVVIAGDNMEEGRRFITYLESDYARSVFEEYGFDPVF